jgi:hypothetical protein
VENGGTIAIIAGAMVAVIVAVAALRKRGDPAREAETEAATRRVYEEEEAAHHGESDDVP